MPRNHEGVEYLTSDDIAEYFEVERNTVNQWVKRGHISPATRVKGVRGWVNLFTRSAVEALAQRKYG